MIRTKRGNPCEIVQVIAGTLVQVRLLYGGALLCFCLEDLRADGGQPELDAALTRCGGVYGTE